MAAIRLIPKQTEIEKGRMISPFFIAATHIADWPSNVAES
jgi:hypothetical protein